jgi:hypothetical protein
VHAGSISASANDTGRDAVRVRPAGSARAGDSDFAVDSEGDGGESASFDHASIPATVTKFFLGSYSQRISAGKARMFSLSRWTCRSGTDYFRWVTMRTDCPDFDV